MSTVIAEQLELLLSRVPDSFRLFAEDEVRLPLAEGKWSRLQILGHLCDSAINNLTRFVLISSEPEPVAIVPYRQVQWVEAQRYDMANREDVLGLWIQLNRSIARIAGNLPEEALSRSCRLPDGAEVTLLWLIEDYVDHLKHHLRQIFGEDYTEATHIIAVR